MANDPAEPERIPLAAQSSLRVVNDDLIHDPKVRVDPEGHETQAFDAEEVHV